MSTSVSHVTKEAALSKREIKKVITASLASRLIVFFSAISGSSLFGVRQALPGEGQLWDIGLPVVNLFSRWDAGHYLSIALNGYMSGFQGPLPEWAFFPLYPMVMRGAGFPLTLLVSPSEAAIIAGFFVSNSLFFLTVVYFYKLSKIVLLNEKLALLSILFFVLWPGSLFYSCVYAEALFMFLTILSLYFLEKNRTTFATISGFLSGWTRPNGFLIAIPFIYTAIGAKKRLLYIQSIIVALPYMLFNLYGLAVTGIFPIREWVITKYWPGSTSIIFVEFLNLSIGYQMLVMMELALAVLPYLYFLISKNMLKSIFSFGTKEGNREAKYYAFTLPLLILTVFYGGISNVHRYVVALIPMYWGLAKFGKDNEMIRTTIVALLSTILVIGSILFSTYRWYL